MSEFWIKLAEEEIQDQQSVFQFWSGINVWIDRPHLLNRKLLANETFLSFSLPYPRKSNKEFDEEKFQYFLNNVFGSTQLIQYINESIHEKIEVVFRRLIPRSSPKFTEVLEAVVRDNENNTVLFWPKESDVLNSPITPAFPYRIKLSDNRIVLEAYRKDWETKATEQASREWLINSVLPKIIKWCCWSPSTSVLPSLNLVSATSYSVNYNQLKEKYAKQYIKIWPECSDPLKYVYEDIAIAAYLMTLWEKEKKDQNLLSKQTFVDLGCGNGLLVDILASEGYRGIGIDVRKRKIWDLYEEHTTLIEKAIEPSDYHIFPNYDWIIGNHSDELTPWIPVIAARSSYKMRVFLLPCCAYTFNGKYERCSQSKSQYQSYLTFIKSLCENMGFVVREDKLRIPSTKRRCFVCTSRNYNEDQEKNIDIKRKEFIEIHCKKEEKTPSSMESMKLHDNKQNWINNFKPREQVELVQNCSQLDRKFLENTVLTVANMLLKTENYITLQRGSESILWNSGGKIKLCDLIEMLDPQVLKSMKNQCGGFQTFLRNHKNVFQIIDGIVQLTVPMKGVPLNSKPAGKRKRRKTKEYNFKEKPCFFFFHHPQGCALEIHDCNFSHQIIEAEH